MNRNWLWSVLLFELFSLHLMFLLIRFKFRRNKKKPKTVQSWCHQKMIIKRRAFTPYTISLLLYYNLFDIKECVELMSVQIWQLSSPIWEFSVLESGILLTHWIGGKYLVFLSSLSVKTRDSSAFSVCIFFEESVFIFQFLNDKMHSYVKQNIIYDSKIEK